MRTVWLSKDTASSGPAAQDNIRLSVSSPSTPETTKTVLGTPYRSTGEPVWPTRKAEHVRNVPLNDNYEHQQCMGSCEPRRKISSTPSRYLSDLRTNLQEHTILFDGMATNSKTIPSILPNI